MIRVAVVAPALAVRAGLRSLLSGDDALAVISDAPNLADLGPLPADTDVLILAAEAFSRGELKQALDSATTLAVLLLANEEINAAQVFSGLRLRAWGVLALDATAEELRAALIALNEGLFVGAPALVEPLFVSLPDFEADGEDLLREPLTGRETEVLQLLAQGLANKQIAIALGISEHTVKFHVSGIYAKMGVTNRTEAARQGVRLGLIVL